MSYLVLAGALLLLPLALNLLTSLDTRQKLYVYAGVAALLLLVWLYETQVTSQEGHNRDVVLAFTQGQTVLCKGQSVSAKEYNYVSGTLSFVGKNDSPAKGRLYRVEECQPQESH